MAEGKIKRLTDKGFGFIDTGTKQDMFFHSSNVEGVRYDELREGRVHDAARTDYIARHIDAVADAMAQGVPMAGYMVWSLLDNFEWASGYEKRFGIVHVDYATGQRTLKDSALWYRGFLQRMHARRAALRRQGG